MERRINRTTTRARESDAPVTSSDAATAAPKRTGRSCNAAGRCNCHSCTHRMFELTALDCDCDHRTHCTFLQDASTLLQHLQTLQVPLSDGHALGKPSNAVPAAGRTGPVTYQAPKASREPVPGRSRGFVISNIGRLNNSPEINPRTANF